ncbi:hypothetical protein BKA70DRAFT_768965 [Coprinopsis sp. MPI-PUGE-AT-0042]|nr:hypothetical protein BKA70DRAFT_768965 [Coprinopsis sp. MPI-PUGE-AT-0042]
MSSLPAELVSSVIAFVWKDAQETRDHGDINACSICCQDFYRESRLWMFKSIELQDDRPSMAQPTRSSSLRVLNRLSQLRTLMQDNPALGDNVASLALQFPWDGDTQSAIIKQRDANVTFLLKEAKMLKHLTFEASSRPDWNAIDASIRHALHVVCSSRHLSTLQFSRVVCLPAYIATASTATSLRLRDVSLDNSFTNPCSGCINGTSEQERSQISNLSVEYSHMNDVLSTWPLTFGRLRTLHTRLAVSQETQPLIDATRRTLEAFSCEGKAMVRKASPKLPSEEAAGVGPFAFQGCNALRSLTFRYSTPRGSIGGFTSVLIRSLESIEPSICLDELNITFQTSTCADLAPLLSSPLWSQMDTLFSQRKLFRRVQITLEPDGRLLSMQFTQNSGLKSTCDMGPLARALDASTRFPHLLKAKAILFYFNSVLIPDRILYPSLYDISNDSIE